jgi:hypothetical protein
MATKKNQFPTRTSANGVYYMQDSKVLIKDKDNNIIEDKVTTLFRMIASIAAKDRKRYADGYVKFS